MNSKAEMESGKQSVDAIRTIARTGKGCRGDGAALGLGERKIFSVIVASWLNSEFFA